MNMIDISMVVVGLALVAVAIVMLNKLKPEYEELKAQFVTVDKETSDLEKLQKTYSDMQMSYRRGKGELARLEKLIARFNIGVGTVDYAIYKRTGELTDLDAMKSELQDVKQQLKDMVQAKTACINKLGNNFVVNGKKSEAKKLINREVKLRLRCFDNEVKAAIALADWNNIYRLVDRVNAAFDDINKRGEIIQTFLQPGYQLLKVRELKLSFEIAQLTSEIREQEREEARIARQAEREEARVKASAEKASKDRERMEKLVQAELAKIASATDEQRELYAQHQQELEELKAKEARAVSMAQLTRSGYVYVISNELSFGKDMVKIGMTRRVDPYERVHELGDASVPDTFDVHAFFYSEDAPSLETYLHKEFSDQQVNLVNSRKEFFFVGPETVMEAVKISGMEAELAEV